MGSQGHTETQALQPVHSAASPLTIATFSGSSAVSGAGMSAGLVSSDRMSTGQFSVQSPHPSHVSTLIVTMYAIGPFLRLHHCPCPSRRRTTGNGLLHQRFGSCWGSYPASKRTSELSCPPGPSAVFCV